MKRFFVKISVLIAVLCLTACASVPLGTMWKMHRMGPEGLINTPPEHVRAAVMSELWFLDKDSFDQGSLNFTFTEPDGWQTHEYEFTMLDVTRPELRYLDTPPESQRWRVYAIAPDQLESFQSMQRTMDGWYRQHEMKDWSLSMVYRIGDNDDSQNTDKDPGEAQQGREILHRVPFRVDLRLIPEEGYFTLVRSTRINIYDDRETPDEA